MAAAVTRSQMNGWYKNRYGEKNNLLPEESTLQRDFPFQQSHKIGEYYVEPTKLRRSHGITIKGGANLGTVYDLNSPVSPEWKQAQVQGAEITLREQIAVGAIAAAVRGDSSYGDIVDETVLGLDESHRFYLELSMLYGQTSIAEIESVSGSGTTRAWVIKKAAWAPLIWAGGEGMTLDAFSAPGGTQRNGNALISLDSIDPDTRTLNVSGNATDLGNVVANDVLVVRMADGALFAGIDKAITNTATFCNINPSTYNLWKGNVHDALGSALTMGLIGVATTKAVVRGLKGKFTWYVNPYSWANLADNENALRRYADKSNQKYAQGAQAISFTGSNGSEMEIKPHGMVKAGEAFGIKPDSWKRGGECDLTDDVDGTNEDFFHEVPGKSAREYRNFSSQFFFCREPAKQVKIKNLAPTGLA